VLKYILGWGYGLKGCCFLGGGEGGCYSAGPEMEK